MLVLRRPLVDEEKAVNTAVLAANPDQLAGVPLHHIILFVTTSLPCCTLVYF